LLFLLRGHDIPGKVPCNLRPPTFSPVKTNHSLSARRASCSGARNGVALIIVLAFVVLLSILLVSFVSFVKLNRTSTASYSKSIQAQEVAQGGIQDILNDLRQEIIAGSVAQTGTLSTYTPSYIPTTNWTAMPAYLGYTSAQYGTGVTGTLLPKTLLRVSRASQDGNPYDFYPNTAFANAAWYPNASLLTNYASAANSAVNSVNGRNISAARWNKICLLSTNTTIPPAFTASPPDWVYMSRAGRVSLTGLSPVPASVLPKTSLTTTTPILGRYAYAVYDEGALLDANWAGHLDSALNFGTLNLIKQGNRTSPLFADLSSIPGLTATAAQAGFIDPFVRLRGASFGGMGTSGAVSTGNDNAFFTATGSYTASGLLTFFVNTATGTADSPFLSRQDLINYFAKVDPANAAATTGFNTPTPGYSTALPYLGTFSRSTTAPSWRPLQNATEFGGPSPAPASNGSGNVFAYRSNAESTAIAATTPNPSGANPNRDIPTIRFANAGTVRHYSDTGTFTSYTVKAGDPLVQHRFSLAKLAWIGHLGPNSAATIAAMPGASTLAQRNQAILDCFGLEWDATNLCWNYNHTATVSPMASPRSPNTIMTLDQVASVNAVTGVTGPREPDFFELLKAGILAGSIAQNPGKVDTTGTGAFNGVVSTYNDYYYSESDRHIRQIGANIIDQADNDNYSTAIYQNLDPSPTTTPFASKEQDLFNTVFGIENLPYLQRVWGQCFSPAVTGTVTVGQEDIWMVPEVWSPHASSSGDTGPYSATTSGTFVATTGTYVTPFHLRMVTFGDAFVGSMQTYANTAPTTPDNPLDRPTTGAVVTFGYDPTKPAASGTIPFLYVSASTGTNNACFDSPSTISGWGTAGSASITNFQDGTTGSYTLSGSLTLPAYSGTTTNGVNENWVNYVASKVTPIRGSKAWNFGTWFHAFLRNTKYTSHSYVIDPFHAQTVNSANEGQLTFALQYFDGTNWLPYTTMARVSVIDTPGSWTYGTGIGGVSFDHSQLPGTNSYFDTYAAGRPDPRTDRFSAYWGNGNRTGTTYNHVWGPGQTIRPSNYNVNDPNGQGPGGLTGLLPQTTSTITPGQVFTYTGASGVNGPTNVYLLGDWMSNLSTDGNHYSDPDGVIRPADGWRKDTTNEQTSSPSTSAFQPITSYAPSYPAGGDGQMTWEAAYTGKKTPPYSACQTAAPRPVVLNRPFQSVGELGYVFRDLPFKSLDFWSPASADSALLDLFSTYDEPLFTAGQVDLNAAAPEVIQSLLNFGVKQTVMSNIWGTAITGTSPGPLPVNIPYMDPTVGTGEAAALAQIIASDVATNGPLNNRSEIISRFNMPVWNNWYSLSAQDPTGANRPGRNKGYGETYVRNLAPVVNTRTWSLLIDVVAQSGHMSPNASTLNDFVVEGEKRYWLHIAIDRYTGKIVDQQLEPVYE